MVTEPLFGVKEAARRLGVPTSWVYQATDKGQVPYLRIGRYIRFDPVEFTAWKTAQRGDTPAVKS